MASYKNRTGWVISGGSDDTPPVVAWFGPRTKKIHQHVAIVNNPVSRGDEVGLVVVPHNQDRQETDAVRIERILNSYPSAAHIDYDGEFTGALVYDPHGRDRRDVLEHGVVGVIAGTKTGLKLTMAHVADELVGKIENGDQVECLVGNGPVPLTITKVLQL